MAFQWRDNLALAQELAKRSEETALRCAIGRAYYAVFGEARQRWIQEHGAIPLDIQVHNFLWNEYKRADRLRKFIGQDGAKLLAYRNLADYEEAFPDLKSVVERVLIIAKKVLDNLDAL